MEWFYSITNFLIGACVASHAALICDRFDQANFWSPHSYCQICYTELGLLDEIPLISYLFLHGKCRYCHNPIPVKLPIIEAFGGFSFISLDLSQSNDLLTCIILFSILLAAICDFEVQEFHLVMILPAIFLAFIRLTSLSHYQLLDYLEFLPISLLLITFVWQHKLGSGDLIIYLVLVFFFSPHFANLVFLTGSVCLILYFCFQRKKYSTQKAVAFIPYLFLGLILQLPFN
ncbi:A24 family peptidase [Lactobacillus sp. ESL0681]|uniref:prepilin peptidase n=1 Tax=Lactobacillus sp. ESL0681 TaxID=2983211 RepID=UPI0023F84018|nr:A24 family peptidase [Lactobacillus sp. ESL0681]WEV41120.1 prepilin peptidase [Lactobacillus sp. ESL0681]